MTEDNRARFDRVAGEWDANPGRVALARAVTAAIRDAVPLRGDMRAVDFGAGTGLVTLGLLPYVGSLLAVDASEGMLRVLEAKARGLNTGAVSTLHGDIERVPLPAEAFDLVVSSMVLHHIADVPGTLRRLRSCLTPGGWIALADLDPEDGTFHSDPTGVHHHGIDREALRRWLEAAGFVATAARDAHRMVRPAPEGGIREYPVFLVTGRAG